MFLGQAAVSGHSLVGSYRHCNLSSMEKVGTEVGEGNLGKS